MDVPPAECFCRGELPGLRCPLSKTRPEHASMWAITCHMLERFSFQAGRRLHEGRAGSYSFIIIEHIVMILSLY